MFEKYRTLLSKSPIGPQPCLIPETNTAMKYLPPPSTHPRAIDVGSGQGSWTQALRSRGYDVKAIDLDTSQFPEATMADMHDIPFPDDSFDIVFCTGSFEHAFAPFIVLSEFKRITRNDGFILITLPMADNVKMLQDAGHYCAMSKLQMEEMYLRKLGMKLENWESGEYDTVVGPHQIFGIRVIK